MFPLNIDDNDDGKNDLNNRQALGNSKLNATGADASAAVTGVVVIVAAAVAAAIAAPKRKIPTKKSKQNKTESYSKYAHARCLFAHKLAKKLNKLLC